LAGGDTYTNRKPHPDHLLLPLRDLGLAPEDAVMVGDSQIDAGAARDAGIPFIGVSYGYALEQGEALEAYRIVERFADVTGAIAELARERGLSFPPPGA
jgi:phosphoglycolate phosphatase